MGPLLPLGLSLRQGPLLDRPGVLAVTSLEGVMGILIAGIFSVIYWDFLVCLGIRFVGRLQSLGSSLKQREKDSGILPKQWIEP